MPKSTDSPIEAAAEVAGIIDSAVEEFPDKPPVEESDVVDLPGGLVVRVEGEEKVINYAQVKELNGADEEALYKALLSGNRYHYLNAIVERGTVRLGELDEKTSKKYLSSLLVGDREAIILGVRRMTYGDKVEVFNFVCPECGDTTAQISFDISEDIEVKSLDDPHDRQFEVELRRGAKAQVRLADGSDQEAIAPYLDKTAAERNTITLQRLVVQLTDPQGRIHSMAGEPSLALKLGIVDRATILSEVVKRAPGPEYNKITFNHESCGKEVSLAVDLGDLFLG